MRDTKTKNISQRCCCSTYALIFKSAISSYTRLIIIAYMSCCIFSSSANAQQRYQGRSVNAAADQFLSRANQPMINVDFIVAHTVNTVFHAIREGRELGDTAILQNDGNAGSVVIEAGTNVGDLIIINDNEGDNIVVNK